jgi:hypothetical protein
MYQFLSICGMGLMGVGYLFYHSLIVSGLFLFLSWPALIFFAAILPIKRKRILKDQFRDVLYSVSASIAQGGKCRKRCRKRKII